jgi:hypothetical protein
VRQGARIHLKAVKEILKNSPEQNEDSLKRGVGDEHAHGWLFVESEVGKLPNIYFSYH